MIRRFACAILSSAISVLASAMLLGLGRFQDLPSVLGVFGIRKDHLWQAVVFPLFLSPDISTVCWVAGKEVLVTDETM